MVRQFIQLSALVLTLSYLLVSPAVAQQSTPAVPIISGRVADQRGEVIAGAQVRFISTARREQMVSTDSSGSFRAELAPGEYEVRASAKGFSPLTQRLTIATDRPAPELILTLTIEALPEVVTVTPARVERRIDQLPSSVTVLDSHTVDHAAAQTVDDVLRQIPGFSIFRRSSSVVANPTTQGVSLRGAGASGASRTLVLTDGLPLNDAFGGWVYWDRVPRASIERIEVVRGGSSDLYGSDALSGVINVITRTSSRPTFEAEVSYGNRDTADLTFATGGAWRQWGAFLTGEATRTDGYFIVAPQQRGAADEPAASEHRLLTLRIDRFWGSSNAVDANHSIYLRGTLFDEDRKNGTHVQRNDTTTESLATGYRGRTSESATASCSSG